MSALNQQRQELIDRKPGDAFARTARGVTYGPVTTQQALSKLDDYLEALAIRRDEILSELASQSAQQP